MRLGGRKARPYAVIASVVVMTMGGQEAAPTRAWARPRVQMEQSRMETATGLARGTRTQVEVGEIAAWAENLPPDPPARLGPAAFVLGDATSTAVVPLTFTLSDPDPGDRVRAIVEISTRADFGLLISSWMGGDKPRPYAARETWRGGWGRMCRSS